jgi:CheY-like chemotaxis protein
MMPASPPVTLWLIEDSTPFRVSLARGLERAGAFVCAGAFASAEEALEAVARGGRPQVVLIDVGLPGMDGIEAMGQLRQRLPAAAMIILTVFEDEEKIMRAIAGVFVEGLAGFRNCWGHYRCASGRIAHEQPHCPACSRVVFQTGTAAKELRSDGEGKGNPPIDGRWIH